MRCKKPTEATSFACCPHDEKRRRSEEEEEEDALFLLFVRPRHRRARSVDRGIRGRRALTLSSGGAVRVRGAWRAERGGRGRSGEAAKKKWEKKKSGSCKKKRKKFFTSSPRSAAPLFRRCFPFSSLLPPLSLFPSLSLLRDPFSLTPPPRCPAPPPPARPTPAPRCAPSCWTPRWRRGRCIGPPGRPR